MPIVKLCIPTNKTVAEIYKDLNFSPKTDARALMDSFASIMDGIKSGSPYVEIPNGDSTTSSITITITNADVTADDTVTIGHFDTFTAKASGATSGQFNIGADATETAKNLTNCINNYYYATSVQYGAKPQLLVATYALGVVTIAPVKPEFIYNLVGITIVETTPGAFAVSNGGGFAAAVLPETITYVR